MWFTFCTEVFRPVYDGFTSHNIMEKYASVYKKCIQYMHQVADFANIILNKLSLELVHYGSPEQCLSYGRFHYIYTIVLTVQVKYGH